MAVGTDLRNRHDRAEPAAGRGMTFGTRSLEYLPARVGGALVDRKRIRRRLGRTDVALDPREGGRCPIKPFGCRPSSKRGYSDALPQAGSGSIPEQRFSVTRAELP